MDFQNYDDIFSEQNYPKFRNVTTADGFISQAYSIIPLETSPCICLSGKNWGTCCKNRFVKAYKSIVYGKAEISRHDLYGTNEKNILSRRIEKKSIQKKNISYCFAKNILGNCSDNIVHSHTMSKGNVLKNLSQGEKVIRFNDHKMIDDISLQNVTELFLEPTIEKASTTVSFCKAHDTELFKDIETDGKRAYTNSYLENLEYALKATTFDIYYNIMEIKYMSELFLNNAYVANNLYFENYRNNINNLFRIYPYAEKILNDIESYKTNKTISSAFNTLTIELPIKKINYSLSETISFNNRICFLNAANIPCPHVIISYYGDHKIKYIEKLKILFSDKNKIFSHDDSRLWEISLLCLSSTLNIYFNKLQFDKLSNMSKFYLYILHRFGENFINNEQLSYSLSNLDFVKSLAELHSQEQNTRNEIQSVLYTLN